MNCESHTIRETLLASGIQGYFHNYQCHTLYVFETHVNILFVSVGAEDSRGGQAPQLTIRIRYCYCMNGGECPDFSSLQQGYGPQEAFVLAECQCATGWSGNW